MATYTMRATIAKRAPRYNRSTATGEKKLLIYNALAHMRHIQILKLHTPARTHTCFNKNSSCLNTNTNVNVDWGVELSTPCVVLVHENETKPNMQVSLSLSLSLPPSLPPSLPLSLPLCPRATRTLRR